MKILIGGVTGFIGSALKSKLVKNGHKVIGISRNPRGSDLISWDAVAKTGIPEGVTSVVNLSGRNISEISPTFFFGDNYKKFKEDVFKSRIETTKLLADAVKNCGHPIDSFVCGSAISYYKPHPTMEYTEEFIQKETQFKKDEFLTKLVLDWEEASKIPSKKDIRQIQVRTGVVLGTTGGMIPQIKPAFFLGFGGPLGDGKQWFPWIHIDDMVGIFEMAILTKLPSGPINGTAPNPVTNEEFAKAYARAMNRPAIFRTPSLLIKTIYKDSAKAMLEGQKVIPKKALDQGYLFKYPDINSACRSFF